MVGFVCGRVGESNLDVDLCFLAARLYGVDKRDKETESNFILVSLS